jgi:hypothetical protein
MILFFIFFAVENGEGKVGETEGKAGEREDRERESG